MSGKPIKFMGVGEKLGALEPFYPERMTSRILGMGDIVSLVEKAQKAVKNEEAKEMERRLMEAQFDFNDFLKQARHKRCRRLVTANRLEPACSCALPALPALPAVPALVAVLAARKHAAEAQRMIWHWLQSEWSSRN